MTHKSILTSAFRFLFPNCSSIFLPVPGYWEMHPRRLGSRSRSLCGEPPRWDRHSVSFAWTTDALARLSALDNVRRVSLMRPLTTSTGASYWAVAQTKPNHERVAAQQLSMQGLD